MIYLFDTNILVHYIRESSVMAIVEDNFAPFDEGNRTWISAVSIGEIRSFAMQSKWSPKRINRLEELLSQLLISEVNIEELHHRYAEIDAFGQGKHPALTSDFSARNMGKNDLWIAATASLLEGTLLTTDSDFNHLDGVFLKLKRLS
ncbi:MAG: PIN domain-containing protein [Saprospiraceae bacterium]|nr:PIN domain-containing protein [Saprospiraceae bacterium]